MNHLLNRRYFLNRTVTGLSSLQISGSTRLGADVTSTGNQSYNGAMTLASDAALSSTGTGGTITVSSNLKFN